MIPFASLTSIQAPLIQPFDVWWKLERCRLHSRPAQSPSMHAVSKSRRDMCQLCLLSKKCGVMSPASFTPYQRYHIRETEESFTGMSGFWTTRNCKESWTTWKAQEMLACTVYYFWGEIAIIGSTQWKWKTEEGQKWGVKTQEWNSREKIAGVENERGRIMYIRLFTTQVDI